jgi:hypothetical protein
MTGAFSHVWRGVYVMSGPEVHASVSALAIRGVVVLLVCGPIGDAAEGVANANATNATRRTVWNPTWRVREERRRRGVSRVSL